MISIFLVEKSLESFSSIFKMCLLVYYRLGLLDFELTVINNIVFITLLFINYFFNKRNKFRIYKVIKFFFMEGIIFLFYLFNK